MKLKIPGLGPLMAASVAGLLFCVLFSVAMGLGPLELLKGVIQGAWGGTEEAVATLAKATPLLLTGLAVSVAYQGGLLNIGGEGQLTLGALAAATVAGKAAFLPPPLLPPLALVAGGLAGGLWALPAVWLKQRRNVHEVVSTILLNYVALYLADYLVRGPLGDGSGMGRTQELPPGAFWPVLWESGTSSLTSAPLAALGIALVAQLWLSRTAGGYEAKAAGSNPRAAANAGVSVARRQTALFAASGALAGLAGTVEILAVHHRFYAAFSPGYGFDGIAVAFLVGAVPGWLWLSGLLLASLRSADKWLQLALGVSPNAIFVIEAVLLLAVACQQGLGKGWQRTVHGLKNRLRQEES